MNENNFSKPSNEKPPLSPEAKEAISYIYMMIQECAIMGANDCEFDLLNQLIEQINNSTIEPNEATKQAYNIRGAKADYH